MRLGKCLILNEVKKGECNDKKVVVVIDECIVKYHVLLYSLLQSSTPPTLFMIVLFMVISRDNVHCTFVHEH